MFVTEKNRFFLHWNAAVAVWVALITETWRVFLSKISWIIRQSIKLSQRLYSQSFSFFFDDSFTLNELDCRRNSFLSFVHIYRLRCSGCGWNNLNNLNKSLLVFLNTCNIAFARTRYAFMKTCVLINLLFNAQGGRLQFDENLWEENRAALRENEEEVAEKRSQSVKRIQVLQTFV